MDSQRLRAIILDIEYYLSDEDRRRLHFYVGGAVPRRLRDDPSLAGTLNIMEKLIEEERISENDLTFLIDAFDQIHCRNAVELLKGHLRRNESKELKQSVHDISSIMPYRMINEIEDDQEDKNAHAGKYLILNQQNISKGENIILNSNNININSQIQEMGNNETAISPIRRRKQISSPAFKSRTWQLLIILLLVIGFGILIIFSIFSTIKYRQCSNKLQHCEKTIIKINGTSPPNPRVMCTSTPLRSSSTDIDPNAKWVQNGVTVAGGNGFGNGTNQLSRLRGLYVDDKQTIYVTDNNNHRIVEWKVCETSGRVVAGGNGQGMGTHQLNNPFDVIVDKKRDSLFICDHDNRRVVRWLLRNGTNGETIISNIGCRGLTMDENGSLVVGNYEKDEVRRYGMGDAKGTLIAGGNGRGSRLDQLDSPQYVFVDRNHSVYVSDYHNHRVMKWEEGAKEGIVVAGGQGNGNSLSQLYHPRGVVVDQLGTVYVVDHGNHRIMRWRKGETQGSVIAGGNGEGGQSNQLNNPYGLSFDRQGNLYVADYGNHRVQKFNIE